MSEASARPPAADGAPESPVDRALGWIDRVAKWAIVAAIGVMVVVVAAQVFLRYVAGTSLGWADEVSRLAFVASMFLAVPLGIRTHSHIGVELLVQRLPALAQAGLVRAMALLSAFLMAVVAWQAAKVAMEQWDERMASLEFSAGWFLVPVALGAAHALLHLMRIIAYGPYPRGEQIKGLE